MKVKYIGESFGIESLTDGEVYECLGVESYDGGADLIIVDDSGEDYLYDAINPAPSDMSSKGGKWEIVEDTNNELKNILQKNLTDRKK